MTQVTVGVDIGTTAVKALAVDADGGVVARARVPHGVSAPARDRLEHDAGRAWRDGVCHALAEVAPPGLDVAAVQVAAMVPSLCAVDAGGVPITPGLLYGDARGAGGPAGANPAESGELVGFLRWCAAEAPDAAGYWPAQAVANHALAGVGVIDTVTAMTAVPLFDFTAWDPAVAGAAGVEVDRLPAVVAGTDPVGTVDLAGGALLGPGTIDAFAEQLVAGADEDGDVLVICGATLICWVVVPDWREVPGLWTVPHTAPGKVLVGGASNAGGLFLNWADRLLADAEGRPDDRVDRERVPVWQPYVRGERTPLHDRDRRAALCDLDLTHGPAAVRRAAHEGAGFVVRHHLDLAGGDTRRIVATGGGVRDRGWVQALADCTGLPVDVVAVPEGGARGAAWLARVTAGLEPAGDGSSRWVRTSHRVEPDERWAGPVERRYRRFRELADSFEGARA